VASLGYGEAVAVGAEQIFRFIEGNISKALQQGRVNPYHTEAIR
jgi:hypothetical protein